MAWVVQLLRLALSKGPYKVDDPSPEDGNRSSIRNVVPSSYLEFLQDKVQKPFRF
jgi:hypothetical protein